MSYVVTKLNPPSQLAMTTNKMMLTAYNQGLACAAGMLTPRSLFENVANSTVITPLVEKAVGELIIDKPVEVDVVELLPELAQEGSKIQIKNDLSLKQTIIAQGASLGISTLATPIATTVTGPILGPVAGIMLSTAANKFVSRKMGWDENNPKKCAEKKQQVTEHLSKIKAALDQIAKLQYEVSDLEQDLGESKELDEKIQAQQKLWSQAVLQDEAVRKKTGHSVLENHLGSQVLVDSEFPMDDFSWILENRRPAGLQP